MKRKCTLQLGIFFLSLLFAPSGKAENPGASGSYPGWVIHQQVSQAGPLTIYISSVAVRCNTPMGDTVFIAPKWDCYFFSENTHRYIRFDHDAWLGRLSALTGAGRPLGKGWSQIKSETVKGMPTVQFAKGDPRLPTSSIAWISSAQEFRQASQVILPLLVQIGVDFPPNAGGFPIQIFGHNHETGPNVQVWEWQTTGIQKTNIPSSVFTFPKDFRLAQNEFEVMSAASMDEQMDLYGTTKKEMKSQTKKPSR